ncbi:hypothetical protein H671_2g6364 [Cricetulus griseus]|nr:hypothetical protein H671_2g6364 [Cricetulus griseus]
MEGPDSSYSCLLIHFCWKVDSEARIEPALRGSNDLHIHCAGSQGCDLLLHSVSNAWVHGGATRRHCVGIQVFADVHITLHDGVEGGLMDATGLHAQEKGWKSTSGYRNCSLPMVITCPSGS